VDLLARFGFFDDIRWLFARAATEHFLELKEDAYWDLNPEFLSTLYVEVTRGPQCQVEWISSYLQVEFYDGT